MKNNEFLTADQVDRLVEAIRVAEEDSTGEIRVHVDFHTTEEFAKTAMEIFYKLDMEKTRERNGVLFYVNFSNRYLTIIGDKGIHKKLHQSFWDHLHDEITAGFAKQLYFESLKAGIIKTGKELKKYFPAKGDNPNELPNELTFS